MKISALAMILACSLLAACSSMELKPDNREALLTKQVRKMVTDYNKKHGTQYLVPHVIFEDRPDMSTMIASANYSMWSISINTLWMQKNPCLVFKEAAAHELAHLLADYQEYGEPVTVTLESRRGPQIVAFNGPPMLESSMDEHGKAWQMMARELGAHPCEEGYCYSPRPYSRFPLVCQEPGYAAASGGVPPKGQAVATGY